MRGRERGAEGSDARERESDRVLRQEEATKERVRNADAATRGRIDDLTQDAFRAEPDAMKVRDAWRAWRSEHGVKEHGDDKERRAFGDFDQMFALAHIRALSGKPVLRPRAPDARANTPNSYVSPIRRQARVRKGARLPDAEQPHNKVVREQKQEPDTIPQSKYRPEVREVKQERSEIEAWERVRNSERARYSLAQTYAERADRLRVADPAFAEWAEKRRIVLDSAPDLSSIERGTEYLRALDARTQTHPTDEKNVRHALVVGDHIRDKVQEERLAESLLRVGVCSAARARDYETKGQLEDVLRVALEHPSLNDRDYLRAEFRRLHSLENRDAADTQRMEIVALAHQAPSAEDLRSQWEAHAQGQEGNDLAAVGAASAQDLRLRAVRHVSRGRSDDELRNEVDRHRVSAVLQSSGVVRDAAEFNAMQAAAMLRYVQEERARPRSAG